MPLIYSAQWVLPIVAPPITNGAIAIADRSIAAVGDRAAVIANFPEAPVEDFGDAAILPGFINSHSHLELTVMRGFLESEEHDFYAWLRKLTIARMAMTTEDLLASALLGVIEAARAGITCLGDSSSVGLQSMQALTNIGLRGIVYQESFGPDAKFAAENIAKLRDQIGDMRARETELVRAGVSPHAPYTVSAPQLELIARMATDQNLPVMMHAAESEAEMSFMTEGRGPFAEGLKTRGIEWQAPRISTIEYLSQHGLLETKPLLAHCINVDDQDLDLIKQSRAGIAHCPKSNAKLRHGRAPFAKFIATGQRVGLGSDSVASNNSCDILEEARFATLMARSNDTQEQPVTAEESLFAATLGGAQALGLDDQIGSLQEGKQADIAVVSLNGAHQNPMSSPGDTLIFSSSGRDVILTMVAGEEIYRRGKATTVDEKEIQQQVREIRSRLDSLA